MGYITIIREQKNLQIYFHFFQYLKPRKNINLNILALLRVIYEVFNAWGLKSNKKASIFYSTKRNLSHVFDIYILTYPLWGKIYLHMYDGMSKKTYINLWLFSLQLPLWLVALYEMLMSNRKKTLSLAHGQCGNGCGHW